ncbi:MAG: enoyl-CoA hydratase/isomerase family protein [Candidatus Lokiarchaeota archaeon]|nr:enoyl-CoA hydratase/isomerase family protein [Candidatus Lokiarchaeota archaeon]
MNMDDFNEVIFEKDENGICVLTINAPERRNAMSPRTFFEIGKVLDFVETDQSSKVLILTGSGEGKAFSSGGYFNLKELTKIPKEILDQIDLEDLAQKRLALKFWDFPKPVIAAINGLALGAGITMPLIGADLIYMANDPDVFLGFYFLKRAVVPEFGSSFILPFRIGFHKTFELLFFAQKISAQEAEKFGLINKAIAPERLMPFVKEQALKLLPPQTAFGTIISTKTLVRAQFRETLVKALDEENERMLIAVRTKDFREATRSLVEKRNPHFKGK